VKWKNLQEDNAAYFVTTTTRKFIPSLNNPNVREIIYSSLTFLKDGGFVASLLNPPYNLIGLE